MKKFVLFCFLVITVSSHSKEKINSETQPTVSPVAKVDSKKKKISKKEDVKVDIKSLQEVSDKYRKTRLVKSDMLKIVKTELTGKEIRNEGSIAISDGNFRIESNTPEKSLIVFDGKNLWNEQSSNSEFGGGAQVTHQVLNKRNKGQVLIATLLTKEPLMKHFKVTKSELSEDSISYYADSINADINVKDFKITIIPKKKVVSEISFKDDIGNLTTMKFSNTQFKDAPEKKLFKYTPPKGAQVTKL